MWSFGQENGYRLAVGGDYCFDRNKRFMKDSAAGMIQRNNNSSKIVQRVRCC